MGVLPTEHGLLGPYRYEEVLEHLRGVVNKNVVYMITSADGRWTYGGSTARSSSRFGEHMYEFTHGCHQKPELQHAFNEDGYVLFYFNFCATPQDAISDENAMLKAIHGQEGCLNSAIDAERAWIRGENYIHPFIGTSKSEETKQRISQTRLARLASGEIIHPMVGKHHSDQTKANMSNARKELLKNGYKISEETRTKLSEVHSKGKHPLAKACVVKGKQYDCIASAAEATGLGYPGLYNWVTKGIHDCYLLSAVK